MSLSVKRVLLHVLLPLVAGFCIYFFFRPDVVFVQWFVKREPLIPLHGLTNLQKVFIYSAPDFCWCYSLAAALFTWERWQGRTIRFFPLIVLVLVAGSEFIQFLQPHLFTPDWMDVLAAVLAYLLSYWLIRKRNYEI